jgi:O-antigen ligase
MQTRFPASTPPGENAVAVALLITLIALGGGLLLAFGGPLIAFGLLAALLAAWIVLRSMEVGLWGTLAVICLLPFATLPFKIGITPTFLDITLAAVVAVWLLEFVTGRRRTIANSPLTLPVLLLLLVAIFAFVLGLRHGPLTPTLARNFAELLLSIGFVVVVVDYCRQWHHLERLVQVALLAGGAAGLIAIVLWLLPDTTTNTLLNALTRVGYPEGQVVRYIEENPALSERAIGTAIDPNALGGLLTLFGALALPQLLTSRPLLPRWLIWLISGAIVLALLLTFSRGAFLALGVAAFAIAIARYRQLIPLGMGGLALLFVLPFSRGYVLRLVQGLMFWDYHSTDLASQMRVGEFRDALTLIGRYPLFGVGFAGSPDIDLYLGVANVYLAIGQQMGLLGLAAFAAIFIALFRTAWQMRHAARLNSRHDALWLGLHAAVIGGLATGLFDHYLFNTRFHFTVTAFWLMVGMAAASNRLLAPDQRKSEQTT